jgi:hypothetical protein
VLNNNDIACNNCSHEIINDLYSQLELPSVNVENLTKALSDFENRTKIEEKEINGQKFFCRLTKVYKDMAADGEIKSVGRVLSQKEVALLTGLLFIGHINTAGHATA